MIHAFRINVTEMTFSYEVGWASSGVREKDGGGGGGTSGSGWHANGHHAMVFIAETKLIKGVGILFWGNHRILLVVIA